MLYVRIDWKSGGGGGNFSVFRDMMSEFVMSNLDETISSNRQATVPFHPHPLPFEWDAVYVVRFVPFITWTSINSRIEEECWILRFDSQSILCCDWRLPKGINVQSSYSLHTAHFILLLFGLGQNNETPLKPLPLTSFLPANPPLMLHNSSQIQ